MPPEPDRPPGPPPPRSWRDIRGRFRRETPSGSWRDILRHAALRVLPVAAAFVVAVLIMNSIVMPRFVRHGTEIEIPDVTQLTVAEAKERLAAVGLAVRDSVHQVSPTVPAGRILEQLPRAHTRVKPDRGVRVVVSRGRLEQRVPEISGQTLRYARIALSRDGYELGEVLRVPSERVARNFVMATEPPQQEVAPPGERVNLLVSDGPARRKWVMPDLAGDELQLTADRLNFAGFVAVVQDEGSPWVLGRRRVRTTQPPPGAVVAEGDTIRILGR